VPILGMMEIDIGNHTNFSTLEETYSYLLKRCNHSLLTHGVTLNLFETF